MTKKIYSKIIEYIKMHRVRTLIAVLYTITMMLFLASHLSMFSERALEGINVTDQKEWYSMSRGTEIEQSFISQHKQLDRICFQFKVDDVTQTSLVEIALLKDESVLYSTTVEVSDSSNSGVEAWINTGILLEDAEQYSITVKRIDEGTSSLYVRCKNLADTPFAVNGEAAEEGILLAFEYHYINKIHFALCFLIVCLTFFAIMVQLPLSDKVIKVKEGVYLLLMPLLMYCLFEWMINGTIPELKFGIFNYIWMLVCYGIVCVVFRNINLVVGILSSCFYVLAYINYHVILYRERPLLPWDVKSFSTALTIAGDFQYEFNYRMYVSLLILIFVLACNGWYKKKKQYTSKVQIVFGVGTVVVSLLWGLIFYKTDLNVRMNFWTNMWNMQEAYAEQGFILSTFNNLRYFKAEKPEQYSSDDVKAYLEDVPEENGAVSEIIPENIIVIQSESFTDFSTLGNFSSDRDCLEYFHSVQNETSNGTLVVSSYGGGTCDTEWEVLTGNTLIYLTPSIVPYQTYVNDDTVSLAKIMHERGYRTIAMHPNVKENWNREQVFEDMAFEEFIDQSAYEGKSLARNYYSDMANTEMIIETYEQNKGEPLFIFNISMQNHGGYNIEGFESTVHVTGSEGDMSDVNQFLSLTKLTDDSIKVLFEYFEEQSEPTMIVIYGDHQPSLNLDFYKYLYGKEVSEMTDAEGLNLYKTPIMIWTNYPSESKDLGEISSNYLGAVIIEAAGLEPTSYQKFLLNAMGEFPIFTTRGCTNSNGEIVTLEDILGSETGYRYQCIQYNNLFDVTDDLKDYYQ